MSDGVFRSQNQNLRALDFKAQTTKIYTKVQVLYMLQNCLITKKISYALELNQQHLS